MSYTKHIIGVRLFYKIRTISLLLLIIYALYINKDVIFNKIKSYFGKTENYSSRQIVLFHLPGCGHCERLRPSWNKLVSDFSNNSLVSFKEVSGDLEPEEVQKYNITGFPTILQLDSGVKVRTYTGDRSLESLKLFVEEAVNM